jgi:hypothetical protein
MEEEGASAVEEARIAPEVEEEAHTPVEEAVALTAVVEVVLTKQILKQG